MIITYDILDWRRLFRETENGCFFRLVCIDSIYYIEKGCTNIINSYNSYDLFYMIHDVMRNNETDIIELEKVINDIKNNCNDLNIELCIKDNLDYIIMDIILCQFRCKCCNKYNVFRRTSENIEYRIL